MAVYRSKPQERPTPSIHQKLTCKRRTERVSFVEVDARKFVALSTELTHELVLEGLARELVNKIQNMRKDADFNVSDRIKLSLTDASPLVDEAFQAHREYILRETLTTAVVDAPGENAFTLAQKLNDEQATLSVEQI